MDKPLESMGGSRNVEFNGGILSFKDCPNQCIDGYYFDPYKHRRIKCDYCESKRRSMVKDSLVTKEDNETIYTKLHLPKSFAGVDSFNVDSVIPEFAQTHMLKDSVSSIKSELTRLFNDISVGVVSDHSILFNLGKKAFESNFIYAYLLRAYQAGVLVSPYVTDYDLSRLISGDTEGYDFTYNSLLHSDVCVVVILSGASINNVNIVKGLMQARAHYDKSTIIFTNSWGSYIRDLCLEGDVVSLNLATLCSIEYDEKYVENEKKYKELMKGVTPRDNGLGMSSKEFNNLLGSKSTLQ